MNSIREQIVGMRMRRVRLRGMRCEGGRMDEVWVRGIRTEREERGRRWERGGIGLSKREGEE